MCIFVCILYRYYTIPFTIPYDWILGVYVYSIAFPVCTPLLTPPPLEKGQLTLFYIAFIYVKHNL